MSAINASYPRRHVGQIISHEIVDQDDGAYRYSFLVNGFSEYRIIDKELIERRRASSQRSLRPMLRLLAARTRRSSLLCG